jgi:hypothetical protein
MGTNAAAEKTRGTEFLIPNFVNSSPLAIQSHPRQTKWDVPLVDITQRIGSLSFQHTLTFDQCHLMAAALCEAANEARAMFQAANAPKPTTRAKHVVNGVRTWVDLPADTATATTSAEAPALQ